MNHNKEKCDMFHILYRVVKHIMLTYVGPQLCVLGRLLKFTVKNFHCW